jgi:hypothetical protein
LFDEAGGVQIGNLRLNALVTDVMELHRVF